jgi:glycerophosphoryl diester phosphodiesterase
MLVLAHRGANRLAPENTVTAFTRALELGADGVELDVHRTHDGLLIVRHDADTGAGITNDLPFSTVRETLPDVPTLAEALDACAGRLVNVEIKNLPGDPDWDPADRAAELLVGLLAARAGRDDVLVSSFNLATVDRVRALDPAVPTAWLTFGRDAFESLETAAVHGHSALHPDLWSLPGGTDRGAGLQGLVERAHERGVRVNVWTVNDDADVVRMAAAGVDAVVSDVPDTALRALGR